MPVRTLTAVLAVLVLAGCASAPVYEEPLPRSTYQKVNIAPYAGAASDPGSPAATARGTRYRTGSPASAAADWSRWPAGTVFRVLSTGEIFEVDDYTDDIVGTNTLLLYKPTSAALPNPTPRQVTIEILSWGSPRESAILLRQQPSTTSRRILEALLTRYPQRL